MRFVNLVTDVSREELLNTVRNYELVNERVKFDENEGKPTIRVKEKKNGRIRITCEMVGGATRDNGFLVGTYFSGTVKEKEGKTRIKGVLTTAPIYHFALFLLTVYFIYKCISLRGFNPVPIILLGFNYLLFKKEYRKQGLIARYLSRAVRYAEEASRGRKGL